MKRLPLLPLMLLTLIGCAHPQPAPSPNPVIGWTLTPGAGAQASWTQTLYIAKVATLTTACPTPGGAAYTQQGTVTGTAASFSDSNETPGAIICAIDQESFVSGGQPFYSAYSPASAPFQVPALPTAPGVPAPTVTTAMNDAPKLHPHNPTVGAIDCPDHKRLCWATWAPQMPGTPKLTLTASK